MNRSPLVRKTPLVRRTRLRPFSTKRLRVNRERRQVADQLIALRGPACEAKLPTICGGRAEDVHERITRARGGSLVDAENLVLLCRSCHRWLTDHPAAACSLGLMAHSWERDR